MFLKQYLPRSGIGTHGHLTGGKRARRCANADLFSTVAFKRGGGWTAVPVIHVGGEHPNQKMSLEREL